MFFAASDVINSPCFLRVFVAAAAAAVAAATQ